MNEGASSFHSVVVYFHGISGDGIFMRHIASKMPRRTSNGQKHTQVSPVSAWYSLHFC